MSIPRAIPHIDRRSSHQCPVRCYMQRQQSPLVVLMRGEGSYSILAGCVSTRECRGRGRHPSPEFYTCAHVKWNPILRLYMRSSRQRAAFYSYFFSILNDECAQGQNMISARSSSVGWNVRKENRSVLFFFFVLVFIAHWSPSCQIRYQPFFFLSLFFTQILIRFHAPPFLMASVKPNWPLNDS